MALRPSFRHPGWPFLPSGNPAYGRLVREVRLFLAILRPANPWGDCRGAVIAAVKCGHRAGLLRSCRQDLLTEEAPDPASRTRPLSGSLGISVRRSPSRDLCLSSRAGCYREVSLIDA